MQFDLNNREHFQNLLQSQFELLNKSPESLKHCYKVIVQGYDNVDINRNFADLFHHFYKNSPIKLLKNPAERTSENSRYLGYIADVYLYIAIKRHLTTHQEDASLLSDNWDSKCVDALKNKYSRLIHHWKNLRKGLVGHGVAPTCSKEGLGAR